MLDKGNAPNSAGRVAKNDTVSNANKKDHTQSSHTHGVPPNSVLEPKPKTNRKDLRKEKKAAKDAAKLEEKNKATGQE